MTSAEKQKRILLVTPAPKGSRGGNRVTAPRVAGLLRQLGHRVSISTKWNHQPFDVLIALHVVKSATAVLEAVNDFPDLPVIMLLAGTDIYPEFKPNSESLAAIHRADFIVALYQYASQSLPANLARKTKTIVQSATSIIPTPDRHERPFTTMVLAHLREVKQPLEAVKAINLIPGSIDVALILAGARLDEEYAKKVDQAIAKTTRATWIGEVSRKEVKNLLASNHLCMIPSLSEGGANILSESIAAGTPIVCSSVPGNLGLLGDDWPATFPAGDVVAMAKMIERLAVDKKFYQKIAERTESLQPMVSPATERKAWEALLNELLE